MIHQNHSTERPDITMLEKPFFIWMGSGGNLLIQSASVAGSTKLNVLKSPKAVMHAMDNICKTTKTKDGVIFRKRISHVRDVLRSSCPYVDDAYNTDGDCLKYK
jgi:hypothetical protein